MRKVTFLRLQFVAWEGWKSLLGVWGVYLEAWSPAAALLNTPWRLLRGKERSDRKLLWHDSNLPMGKGCHWIRCESFDLGTAQHRDFWPLSNCNACLCICWLYFHVPSNQFLYVSHFAILLEAKLEEQAVWKSCDIADFPSVLELNDKASVTSGVTLPTDSIP